MVKVGLVGLGKMGLSHLAMVRAHPDVTVAGVVDSTGYILDVLGKYTGLQTFGDLQSMMDGIELDAVVIATPNRLHYDMVGTALRAGLNVFCEKPLCLTSAESSALAGLAAERGLVTQVGYHNRFVGAFAEVKRLLDLGAIGRVTHVLAEAYGPVVLAPKGSTWRSRRSEGGGCLYDYAAHPVNLLTWYLGAPSAARGSVLGSVFSQETEDEVFSTLKFPGGATGQVSVNWSDESCRKMTTKMTLWGTEGRINVDRQECQVYLRETADIPDSYGPGWNVKYTTELTEPVWFYLRGEEYSAQLDHFVRRVAARDLYGTNTFESAAITDRALELISRDAAGGWAGAVDGGPGSASPGPATSRGRTRRRFPRFLARRRK